MEDWEYHLHTARTRGAPGLSVR